MGKKVFVGYILFMISSFGLFCFTAISSFCGNLKYDTSISLTEFQNYKEYDGTAASLPTIHDIYTNNTRGEFSAKWYKNGIELSSAPVDAGKYEIEITIKGKGQYEEGSQKFDYEIGKIQSEITYNYTTSLSKTYDGKYVVNPGPDDYSYTGDGKISFRYYFLEKGIYYEMSSKPITKGNYKLRIELSEGKNYYGTFHDVLFSISDSSSIDEPHEQLIFLSPTLNLSKTYDGFPVRTITDKDYTVKSTPSKYIIYSNIYEVDSQGKTISGSISAFAYEPGNYRLVVTALDKNYREVDKQTHDFTISKAKGSIKITSSSIKTFDGKNYPLTYEHNYGLDMVKSPTVKYYCIIDSNEVECYNYALIKGKYKVVVSVEETEHYSASTDEKIFTIS